jgi:hypothetical protein
MSVNCMVKTGQGQDGIYCILLYYSGMFVKERARTGKRKVTGLYGGNHMGHRKGRRRDGWRERARSARKGKGGMNGG